MIKIKILRTLIQSLDQRIEELKPLIEGQKKLAHGSFFFEVATKRASKLEAELARLENKKEKSISELQELQKRFETLSPEIRSFITEVMDEENNLLKIEQEISKTKKVEWFFGTLELFLKGCMGVVSLCLLLPILKILAVGGLLLFGGEQLISEVIKIVKIFL